MMEKKTNPLKDLRGQRTMLNATEGIAYFRQGKFCARKILWKFLPTKSDHWNLARANFFPCTKHKNKTSFGKKNSGCRLLDGEEVGVVEIDGDGVGEDVGEGLAVGVPVVVGLEELESNCTLYRCMNIFINKTCFVW